MGTALVYLGLQVTVLYQTLFLLVMAYILRFLPLAVGAVRSTAARLDAHLVQSARLLGASRFEGVPPRQPATDRARYGGRGSAGVPGGDAGTASDPAAAPDRL